MDNIVNKNPSFPEFVGRTVLDTISLVIPSIDKALWKEMQIQDGIYAIGLVMADKALKSAKVSLLKFMTADKGTSHSDSFL